MKKRNARILTALLLTLCLLLGSVAALADNPEITVTEGEKENEAIVTIDGDVADNGRQEATVNVNVYKDEDANKNVPAEIHVEVNGEFVADPLVIGADSVIVNTDGVTNERSFRTEEEAEEVGGPEGEDEWYDPNIHTGFQAADVYTTDQKSVTVNVDGNLATTAKGGMEGDTLDVDAFRGSAYDSDIQVIVNGDLNVNTTYGHAAGIDTRVGDQGTTSIAVNGDITTKSDHYGASGLSLGAGGAFFDASGMVEHDGGTIDAAVEGNISVTGGTEDETVGIEARSCNGSQLDASVAGSITVTGKNYINGMNLHAFEGADTTAIVKGDVIATGGSEGETNGAQAENHGSAILINVGGNVQAKSDEVANGLHLNAYDSGNTTVVVKGDVTAEGRDGTGLMIDEILEDASVTVVVEGTLSGSAAAIKTTDVRSAPDVVVWQATENKDGRIAEVYQVVEPYLENPDYDPALDPEHEGWYIDENNEYIPQLILDEDNASYDVDAEASAKLEAAIWYIAKVADSFKATLTATATKKTVDGTDYQVAHENDKVKLTFALDEAEEGLDGILYNAEDKTAAKADEWGKNDDGSYWVKMLRGGGMLLGLSTHKHQKATREENRVEATCAKVGSYDEVVYCSACKMELSRKAVAVDKLAHTPAEAVKENVVAATCEKAGSYDEVVYCSACKTELSRKAVAVDKLAHTPAEAVRENIVAAKPGVAGSYDNVVYCSACKTELSREHVATPALPVEKAPAADPAPALEFVYEDVDEEAEVNGVKAADHPEAAEALATVGESLDGEGETVTVEIPSAEKLMDEEELKTFNALPVKDRLLVVLSALGFVNDEQTGATEGMGADAQALSESIAERMANLPEAEKQALLSAIAAEFPKGTVTVDGQAYESFSIDLVIDRNGNKSYERYTFYDENGAWKLYGIEKGVYKEV